MDPLTISNLSVSYNNQTIIADLNLTLKRAGIVALVGPNGAGKSTLIRAITGVIPSTRGSIYLGQLDILGLSALERARRIAVVPQHAPLPDNFKVQEIVMLGRTPYLPLWKNESAIDHASVTQALQRTNLTSLKNRFVSDLSGGELQRVVIARALAQDPDVLLLDEPTAHLDLKHQASILRLIKSLATTKNIAVLLTMHDINQAAKCADSVALISNGNIQAYGSPTDIYTSQILSKVYDTPVEVIIHPDHGLPFVTIYDNLDQAQAELKSTTKCQE
jgi:iron complex transport system ATP-binding protein